MTPLYLRPLLPPEEQVLCLDSAYVSRTLSRVNPRKAPGSDNIPGQVLRDRANQLADVLADTVNTSPSQAFVPAGIRKTTIIPVPKKSTVTRLNDYRPVALTPIMMKCFRAASNETHQIHPPHLTGPSPVCKPLQSAPPTTPFRQQPHLPWILGALMLECCSLTSVKHSTQSSLRSWQGNFACWASTAPSVIGFQTSWQRTQREHIGNRTSASIARSTGTPQGCMLSPLPLTLLTHNCSAKSKFSHVIKFADD